MIEAEFPSVQHLAGKISGSPTGINRIAQNRMTEMLKVNANLMRSSAVQTTLDQARGDSTAKNAKLCARGSSTFTRHRHFGPVNTMPRDRGVDRSRRFPQFSGHKGEINFLHRARGELP